MRLWKTPDRLRRLAWLLFLLLPLAFFAQLLARRMPWWKWSFQTEWPKFAVVFGALCVVALGIFRTKRWAFYVVAVGLAAFTLTCLAYSVRQENVGLGLYSIALGIAAIGYVDRLGAAYLFPAISPGMRWYQSLPEPIPGLSVDWGERKGLRLSRLDLEGGFILGRIPKVDKKDLPNEITLHYRGSKISCRIEWIASLPSKIDSSWAGIGVEFRNKDRDAKKDLADFIEVLRGEGHVVTG
jgi:hypothetical protein